MIRRKTKAKAKARTRARTRGPAGPAGPQAVGLSSSNAGGPTLAGNSGETTRYEVFDHLRALVSDPTAPAAARVNAARTLAEMDGLIGRHQVVPERDTPSLATLSREALIAELERLRTAVELGIVS
jgi:hypothetical protein